jgi:ankyrin repeat protein
MAQRLNISGSKDTTRKPDLARQKLSAEKMVISPGKQKRLNRMILDAARSGNTKRAERLMKAGASIETQERDGTTALMWSATNGHAQTCKILLEHNADIEAKYKNGTTALMWSARNGKTETCALLVEKGARIEAKDNDGETALMYSAWQGHTQTCALLIEKGADINAKAKKGEYGGMTAFSIAKKEGNEETAAFLKSIESLQESVGKEKSTEFLSHFNECISGGV